MPARFWIAGMICSMLPDADAAGLSLGMPYGAFLGHRGFTHSLVFALLLAPIVVRPLFRNVPPFSRFWWVLVAYFAGVTASHGVLDAMTDGGLGIALLSPLDTTRYFLPWRPIEVSPIGLGFFSRWGVRVMRSELVWVWAPFFGAAGIAVAIRAFRRARSRETDGSAGILARDR